MRARVRFAGGSVPVWSLVVPIVILSALSAAFAAAAVSEGRTVASSAEIDSVAVNPSAQPSAEAPVLAVEPRASAAPSELDVVPARTVKPLDVSALPSARAASSAEPPADFEATPERYVARELLAFADSRSRSAVVEAQELDAALDRDPGRIKEPETRATLRRLSDNPETARVVLGTVAKLPGPISADILYELWTGTVEKTATTELARALLYSRDVRPKASPALSVALDLRELERCEDAKPLLARAVKEGDRRSLHLVIKLQRKYGCGPNKRQDCYACLRKGDELENAIKAVKARPEPRTLSRR
jgi:hypothetical protein